MPRNPAKKTVSPAAVATLDPPKPKARPKKPSAPEPSDLITDEIGREQRLAIAREDLVFRRHELLKSGDELSASEMRLLATAHPKSLSENDAIWQAAFAKWLRREDARVAKILALQESAGTPDDRNADDKLAQAAAEALGAQGPKIREQITTLQSQLDDLHQAAINAEQQAVARRQAVDDLKSTELLPAFVLDELAANHLRDTAAFERELNALGTRQTQIEGLLALDITTDAGAKIAEQHVGSVERFGGDTKSRVESVFNCTTRRDGTNNHWIVGSIRREVWAAYLDELRGELTDVQARIADIVDGPAAEAQTTADTLKSLYVPV